MILSVSFCLWFIHFLFYKLASIRTLLNMKCIHNDNCIVSTIIALILGLIIGRGGKGDKNVNEFIASPVGIVSENENIMTDFKGMN